MMHDTLTCDHPQCHGLTNFLTENEQLRVAWENGDKIRVALIGLEALAEKQRKRIIKLQRKNKIAYEKRRQWGLKGRYIAMRNKAFAYTWTLQIEWLLK